MNEVSVPIYIDTRGTKVPHIICSNSVPSHKFHCFIHEEQCFQDAIIKLLRIGNALNDFRKALNTCQN